MTWSGRNALLQKNRQFYESALNDHENAFRNIMKTHETKCTKTHRKSLQKRIVKVYESASNKSSAKNNRERAEQF